MNHTWLVLKSHPALYFSNNVFCVSERERFGACDGREWGTNEDVRRVEGASTACFSLARHDGILPRGPPLPPPSVLLLSPLSSPLPPSVFTSLPLLLSGRHPHHNRSISYSVSNLDLEEKSCVFLIFFPPHLHHPWMPARSLFSPSVPRSLSSLPPTPLPPPSLLLCWLAMFFFNTLPLSTTQTSAMEPPLLAVSC